MINIKYRGVYIISVFLWLTLYLYIAHIIFYSHVVIYVGESVFIFYKYRNDNIFF